MLGFIFGLNARLGRLRYFLAGIALAVAMTVLCFLLVFSQFNSVPHDVQVTRAILYATMKWPIIALTVLFCVVSFTLQSMRIRAQPFDFRRLDVVRHIRVRHEPADQIGIFLELKSIDAPAIRIRESMPTPV